MNSAALRDPSLLERLAERMGSQSVVIAIDAAAAPSGGWRVRAVAATEETGRDAIEWAREAVERGAGEILLTSIDRDGTRSGYDLALTRAVADEVRVPGHRLGRRRIGRRRGGGADRWRSLGRAAGLDPPLRSARIAPLKAELGRAELSVGPSRRR